MASREDDRGRVLGAVEFVLRVLNDDDLQRCWEALSQANDKAVEAAAYQDEIHRRRAFRLQQEKLELDDDGNEVPDDCWPKGQ